jgi:hypothetical protein
MPLKRLFLPLCLAFALLFAQQAGAAHALGHAFEQTRQQDQHAPHSPACEQCAAYAGLGGALTAGTYDFALAAAPGAAIPHRTVSYLSTRILAAAARGPPATLPISI